MKYAVLLLFAGACTDPVVDMQLVAPNNAAQLDTSCVSAVEVHVDGPNYPSDKGDVHTSCIPLGASAPTYDKLLDQIRGKFQLSIPDGGLSTVEVYGWAGSCDRMDGDPTTPDLIFFASQNYVGDELMELKMVPNLDCRQSTVNIHLVDLMTLVSGTNPSDANCTAAQAPDAPNTGADTITMMPKLVGKGMEFYGGRTGADSHNSIATFTGLTQIGPKSCLAWEGNSTTAAARGCASPTASVCAGTGEIEAPIINFDVGAASLQNDPNRVKFADVIIASVWTGTSGKHPAVGATIDVDPAQGVVEYVDPPAAGSSKLVVRSTNSTGSSGLFILFTNTLANAKINYNGKTTPVTMSALDDGPGGAILVVN